MFFLCSALICCFISTIPAQGASIGTVRLYRNGIADTNQSWSSGIVQIYYSYKWGNICDDYSFGFEEAYVICNQLGYTGASSYSNTGDTTEWGSDSSPTVMDEVSCSDSYLTITQCSFSTDIISSSCTSIDDVTVTCYSTKIWFLPSTGDIRLTLGKYSNQGLLEVYCNGQWGTVCDDSFGITEARVACRQLGYNAYDSYNHLSLEGTSSQPIFLRSFSGCTIYDDCLTQCGRCPSRGIGSICSHDQDITLECSYYSGNGDVYTMTYDTCSYYNYSTRPIIAAIIGSIIGFIVCTIVIIAVPICICVCFGIRAANRSSTRSRVYLTHQPPSAVVTNGQYTSNTTTPLMGQPQQSAYYSTDPIIPVGHQPSPSGYQPLGTGYEPSPGYSPPYHPTSASMPQQGQERIEYTGYPAQ